MPTSHAYQIAQLTAELDEVHLQWSDEREQRLKERLKAKASSAAMSKSNRELYARLQTMEGDYADLKIRSLNNFVLNSSHISMLTTMFAAKLMALKEGQR